MGNIRRKIVAAGRLAKKPTSPYPLLPLTIRTAVLSFPRRKYLVFSFIPGVSAPATSVVACVAGLQGDDRLATAPFSKREGDIDGHTGQRRSSADYSVRGGKTPECRAPRIEDYFPDLFIAEK
jgi:hypothetical protein